MFLFNFLPLSFNYLSYGNVICGTFIVCLATYTIVSITNGAILPLITFYALAFLLFYSLLTPKPEAPPSLALFFFLKSIFRNSTFFLFFSVVCISS